MSFKANSLFLSFPGEAVLRNAIQQEYLRKAFGSRFKIP